MQSFSPLDVLDEFCDLIESVSEGFLTYSQFYKYNFSGSTTKGEIDECIGKKNKQTNKLPL